MKWLEFVLVIVAMLIPFFAIKSSDISTYVYWTAVVVIYLAYKAVGRWESE